MTLTRLEKNETIKHFNSHPHEEDDKTGIEKKKQMEYFNSHPHEEDDSNFKQK